MSSFSSQQRQVWKIKQKEHSNLYDLKLKGETFSADYETVGSFPDVLNKLAEEKDCLPEQMFNADETGLFWKLMPARSFVRKTENATLDLGAAEDRITLLFFCNAAYEFMLKHKLICRPM